MSILVVIDRIYRYQFKSNYLKNHKIFAAICLHLCYLDENSNVVRKKFDPHRSNISEIIDSERCAYLNT